MRLVSDCKILVYSILYSLAILLTPFLLWSPASNAQSTNGAFVGAVKDSTGGAVSGASVTLVSEGTSAERKTITDNSGNFSFLNIEAGTYKLVIQANGFATMTYSNLNLQARETQRVDATLKVGQATEVVTVQEEPAGVITTDSSDVGDTRTGKELVDLPVAIYSRSNGSTSPISTLTTQPGVQTDGNTLVIAGSTSALTAVTLDGISTMSIEYAGPINELFPSFNSISEMKVTQSNNNAEFGGVADITTTSKSGTNTYHGGVFENFENAALDAGNPFAVQKPKLQMNDFGGYLGGPIKRDKTFVFLSYEGLRLPRETPITTSVPSLAMRSGDLCSYLGVPEGSTTQLKLANGTPIACNAVPISPVSANFLEYLMPKPNQGTPNATTNNYSENMATPISSNQGDVRIDQILTTSQTLWGRYTYKSRGVVTAPDPYCPNFCELAGSPSTGPFQQPENDSALTIAHNWVITPSVLNEIRGGYSRYHLQTTLDVNSQDILNQIGLQGIPNVSTYGAVPSVLFGSTGFQQTGGANPSTQISNTIEISDNVTWTKGKHTFKFGADFRRISDSDDNAFGSLRSGQYTFDGSSPVGATIGDPFASFLQGYPDWELITLINNDKMNGLGYAYAFFAQDDLKITPDLTLNLGLRYELHPPMKDTGYNSGAFLPNYSTTVNGQTVNGALVVPNQQAVNMADPGLVGSVAPTPLLTAAQAGIPSGLRYTDTTDFDPRIGFAWRPFHNDKTVIRGGYGRFTEAPLGFALVAGWATTTSFIPYFSNSYGSNGNPTISFPAPFPSNLDAPQPGAASFYYAFPVHYQDPSVQQWNLTVERDLGAGVGLRLSYVGNHGSNLEVMEDLNQVAPNSLGYDAVASTRPFSLWTVIESVSNLARSNYNALTADVHKNFSKGLQFDASYVFTRDLSNAGGANPTALPTQPANFLSDRFNPNLDYGNVIYDRRNRFLATFLYELPLGKGQKFLSNSPRWVNSIVGGWQWGGVLVFESGPFLTPYQETNDSSGTNEFATVGSDRTDTVPGVPQKVTSINASGVETFLNHAAFAIPGGTSGNAIGRFGNSSVGSVVGPGTSTVSMSFIKSFALTERVNFQFGTQISNIFNHLNYLPYNMQYDSSGFGTVNGVQTAEGSGPRIVELTARISF